MLTVHLLGAAQACYGATPLTGFPHQQPHVLLCYLLLNRQRPHHREQLASLFWSDYPTATSLKYLRDALWRIRKHLQSAGAAPDDYITVTKSSVSFEGPGTYWLDIQAFESTTTKYQNTRGYQLTTEQAAELERASELYVGDLLEGIYEDWCLYDRERLNLLHLSLLDKLAAFHEPNGTYQQGLIYCGRILSYDNTRERVHRQIMRLYWLLGDRDAALKQYQRCAYILREALDIPPMAETQHLYQQMKHDQFPAATGNAPSAFQPRQSQTSASEQALIGFMLRRVHQLRATIDTASAELRSIEHQAREAMFNLQDHASPPPTA